MSEQKNIELLDELYKSGVLNKMINAGFVDPCVLLWRNVYHAYNFRLESTSSKMEAMHDVAENFNLSFETIKKIRKRLQ